MPEPIPIFGALLTFELFIFKKNLKNVSKQSIKRAKQSFSCYYCVNFMYSQNVPFLRQMHRKIKKTTAEVTNLKGGTLHFNHLNTEVGILTHTDVCFVLKYRMSKINSGRIRGDVYHPLNRHCIISTFLYELYILIFIFSKYYTAFHYLSADRVICGVILCQRGILPRVSLMYLAPKIVQFQTRVWLTKCPHFFLMRNI